MTPEVIAESLDRGYRLPIAPEIPMIDAGMILGINILQRQTDKHYSPSAVAFDDLNLERHVTITSPSSSAQKTKIAPGMIRLTDFDPRGKNVMFLTFGADARIINTVDRTHLTIKSTAPILFLGDSKYVEPFEAELYGRFGAWLATSRYQNLTQKVNGNGYLQRNIPFIEQTHQAFDIKFKHTPPERLYVLFLESILEREQKQKHKRSSEAKYWATTELERLKSKQPH